MKKLFFGFVLSFLFLPSVFNNYVEAADCGGLNSCRKVEITIDNFLNYESVAAFFENSKKEVFSIIRIQDSTTNEELLSKARAKNRHGEEIGYKFKPTAYRNGEPPVPTIYMLIKESSDSLSKTKEERAIYEKARKDYLCKSYDDCDSYVIKLRGYLSLLETDSMRDIISSNMTRANDRTNNYAIVKYQYEDISSKYDSCENLEDCNNKINSLEFVLNPLKNVSKSDTLIEVKEKIEALKTTKTEFEAGSESSGSGSDPGNNGDAADSTTNNKDNNDDESSAGNDSTGESAASKKTEGNARKSAEEGGITSISDIEVLSDDIEFNGILPSARKCLTWQEGLCKQWDKKYERSEAAKLGKKLEEGTIEFTDIPIFIVKMIDFLTKLVGTVALLFMIYGGFQLMTDQKDDGKNTIKYAIAGVFVAFLSWLVVNIVKTQFTGVDYYGNTVEQSVEKK